MGNKIAMNMDDRDRMGGSLEQPRVLVVDDDQANRVVVSGILRSGLDVAVDMCASGELAVEMAGRQAYALVLMDVLMDGMDGYEAAAAIRSGRLNIAVPVIFITGAGDSPERIFKGYDAGAVDYMAKPVDSRILLGKARVFIDIYNQRKELERKTGELAGANASLERSRNDLAVSKEKFEKIVENVSEMMFTLSPQGIITFAAKSVEKGLGFGAGDILGKPFSELVLPEYKKGVDTFLSQVNILGEPEKECEVKGLDREGAEHWFSLSASPVLGASGDLIFFVVLALDITERKQREENMEINFAMAEMASMGVVEINDELEKLNDQLIQSQNALRESNALLHKKQTALNQDLEAASGIQHSLLPSSEFKAPNMDISWIYRPSAMVGGDLLGLSLVGERYLSAYVLDVAGHGVGAALVSVSVHQFLQPQNRRTADSSCNPVSPIDVLESLNKEFPITRFDTHFTIFYMLFDLETGGYEYSSAGHNSALAVTRGPAAKWLEERGSIIGLEGIPFEGGEGRLEPGESVIMYTDGIVEMSGPHSQQYGEARLERMVLSCAERKEDMPGCLDGIYRDVLDFGQGRDPRDDITLLGLTFLGK